MAQNQQYTQYPYYTQPQNIYQQLGKPQPQPHLQSAYQQQQQQQLAHVPQQQPYQYVYQQSPQQQPQTQPIQRVPSAHGFQQQLQSSFPGAPGYAPQQQITPHQVYQYAQPGAPAPTPTPTQQAPAMYQRPPSQNSRIPTSSFPNLPPGQPVPNVLPRQPPTNSVTSNASLSGQLVPTSQSLTLRGASPAMSSVSPGPPISPSAAFAQQVQQQRQQQQQQQQQQVPSMALVPANRNSMVVPVQRQVVLPPPTQPQVHPPQMQPQLQPQPQPQPQSQIQHQPHSQIQHQPHSQIQHQLPPIQTQTQHQRQAQGFPPQLSQQHPVQQQGFQPTKPSQRRPLPSPGASRPFSSFSTTTTAPPSSIANIPSRSGFVQRQVAAMTSQPPSPVKSGTSSPTKAPSSPTKTSRPLPTPGGSNEGSNNAITGSPAKEGFAGIGTTRNSSRVTGLPIPPIVTSLVAGIKPESLTILPLPEGSTGPDNDDQDIYAGTDTKGDNSTRRAGSPAKMTSNTERSFNQRRAASPPRFQPGATSAPSPTGEIPPSSLPANSSSKTNSIPGTNSSPTKKFTPVWKRTIPDYPQPAFGYAAGMVSDPFVSSARPPGSTSSSPPKPALTNTKPNQTEKERQRALVERELVERQLQNAMTQAHAQAQAQKVQPISNTSYSAYAMYSQSNPNLHQQSSHHVRSGAYAGYEDDDEDDDDDSGDDEEEDEEDETEETEEERESRRHRHGKRVSEPAVTSGKAKKKKAVKEKKGERKAMKKTKPTPTSRSVSTPPKKRLSRNYVPSTSEDETEATELTCEEGETEEEAYRRTTRHVKSSSVSSSRFKAKVEKEREMLKKRWLSQHDHPDEYYDDEDDTPRKRDQRSNKRRESPPAPIASQRQSHHQRTASSGLGRRGSPSPPANDRASRRVSPPRVTLLKDAQRKTTKLRGDDDDEADERERGRREEVERWKKDERYRSREREREESAMEPRTKRFTNSQQSLYEDDYEHNHTQERDPRLSLMHVSGGQSGHGSRQFPVRAIRDMDERGEWWPRDGRRDERDPNTRIFNLGRQDSPTRHPVRDSVFSTGYRSRPASPTRNPQRQQYPDRDSPPATLLMSPYRSRPSSPTRPTDVRDSGLVTKFSAMNVRGTEREAGRRGQGEWVADPRLARTPGEVSNNPSSGYFDAADRDTNSRAGSQAPTEFARISGRMAAANDYNSSNGNSAKPLRDTHHPHHHSNLNMNLDDPPPRSLSPAISQGSSAYGRGNESPQQFQYQRQPQSFNDRRPQSEIYASPPTNNAVQRRKSFYGDMPSSAPEPPSPVKQRPQSQVYNGQVQPPHPPRPQSIHPFDRANINKANIINGTPKIQTIDIESPAPVGGRDKRPDLDRMMSDPEDDDFPNTARTNVNGEFRGARNRRNEGPTRAPAIQVDELTGPMIQVDSPRGPVIQVDSPRGPMINVESPQRPVINIEPSPHGTYDNHSAPRVQVYEVPGISVAGPEYDDRPDSQRSSYANAQQTNTRSKPSGRGGLICGGCDGPIIGRVVSAMGSRWHPQCFKCTVCGQLLEHVSSYEHHGRPYCHLDYHENFAPRCFSCETAIIEERFISLDDTALGKRTYHEQHFFCAECGDPFLAPSMGNSSRTGELNVKGDGEFESDDVGFTVYKGHPYCEACHVRLRLPKCKKCKKSIRDHERAVEALGGKWCWGCFVCASCERPFDNPSFFQRGDKPFCEGCFDIMLRNEI